MEPGVRSWLGSPHLCRSCWEPLIPPRPCRCLSDPGRWWVGRGSRCCSNGPSLPAGHQRLAGVGHLIRHPGSAGGTCSASLIFSL